MFWQVSVYHSVQGGPMWPLPTMHWTSLNSPSAPPPDLGPHYTGTPQPCPSPQTRDPSLLVTSGGHPLRPVQTCSLEDPHVRWAQSGDKRPTGMLSYFSVFSRVLALTTVSKNRYCILFFKTISSFPLLSSCLSISMFFVVFFLIFRGHKSFLWGHWYPFF